MDFPQKGIIKIQVLYVSYDNNFIKNKKKEGKGEIPCTMALYEKIYQEEKAEDEEEEGKMRMLDRFQI